MEASVESIADDLKTIVKKKIATFALPNQFLVNVLILYVHYMYMCVCISKCYIVGYKRVRLLIGGNILF